jgi:RNA polymerase sigma factor (sigma-70 family)
MLTDAVLVDRVLAGFDDAFDELYRRHANAAWRVGQAVAGNAHDAADAVSEAFARVLQAVKAGRLQDGDAFKSYLLAATRNSALDAVRRNGRSQPADSDTLDGPTDDGSPAELVAGGEDAAIVAAAFRNLPERWRSVLWLTEVEGVATKDAAQQLGLSPNGTAQLAVRARAGLRDRYLQAHVRNHAKPECRFTVDHLGAYVGGSISPRDLAKVDQHLAGCDDCKARKAELEDMGATLRRIVLPIPLGLAAVSATKVEAALASTTATAATAAGAAGTGLAKVVQLAKEPTPAVRRFVGAAAAGILTLGVASIGFIDHGPRPEVTDLALPTTRLASPASAVLPDSMVPFSSSGSAFGDLSRSDGLGGSGSGSGSTNDGAPGGGGGSNTGGGTGGGGTTNPPPVTDPDPTCLLPAALCPDPEDPDDPIGLLPTLGLGLNLDGTPIAGEVTLDPEDPTSATLGLNVGGTEVLDGATAPTDPNTATLTTPLGTVNLP